MIRLFATAVFLVLYFITTQEAALSSSCPPETSPNIYSVNIYSEVQLDHLAQGTWCYESEPAFIFINSRSLMRSDIKGNVSQLLDLPDYVGHLACSEDGRIISFFSHPNVGEPTLRLSIIDTRFNKRAEYLINPPTASEPIFDPGARSFMALDGSVFALPADPKLIAGQDLLAERKIIHVESNNVFWTHKFVFVKTSGPNRYNVKRISDLKDVGVLNFPPDRIVKNIVECQESYFVLYMVDAAQKQILEPIMDPRLGGKIATRVDDVGSVSEDKAGCTIALTRKVVGVEKIKERGMEEITAAEIRGRNFTKLVDMRKFNRLGYLLTASKDGRFLLGDQDILPIGSSSGKSRILILQIEK